MRLINTLQKGFTLIELMIVVAIIGILASIALPAYQTYVAKSAITSVLASASAGKTIMWSYYIDNGQMPENAAIIAAPGSSTEGFHTTMTTLSYASGEYRVLSDYTGQYMMTFKNVNGNVNNKRMAFTYTDWKGSAQFQCSAFTIPNKYLPKQCQH